MSERPKLYSSVSPVEFRRRRKAILEEVRDGVRLIIKRRGEPLALLEPPPPSLDDYPSITSAFLDKDRRLLDCVKDGAQYVIMRHNKPMAVLHPPDQQRIELDAEESIKLGLLNDVSLDELMNLLGMSGESINKPQVTGNKLVPGTETLKPTELRIRLGKYLTRAGNGEPLVVSSRRNHPDVMLLPASIFEGMAPGELCELSELLSDLDSDARQALVALVRTMVKNKTGNSKV